MALIAKAQLTDNLRDNRGGYFVRTRCIIMTTYLVCAIQHVSSKLTGNAQESIRTYYVRTPVRLGTPNLSEKVFGVSTLARIVSSRFCLSVSYCIRTIARTQTSRLRAVFRGGCSSALNTTLSCSRRVYAPDTYARRVSAPAPRDTGNAHAGETIARA